MTLSHLIIIASSTLLTSAYAQSKTTSANDVPRTRTISSIQYGVTDGSTGKPAVYVYFKDRAAEGFNPSTDREVVYTENLTALRRTVEYQLYINTKS